MDNLNKLDKRDKKDKLDKKDNLDNLDKIDNLDKMDNLDKIILDGKWWWKRVNPHYSPDMSFEDVGNVYMTFHVYM